MHCVEYQLPDITVRGLTLGEADLPVILCLHGWLDNAASFELLAPYLPHYHLVMIDLPGHGFSDHKSAGAYYHFIDWLSDIYQLFETAGWQQVHIIGHSMGAMIATAFAAAFPEKIKTLTLIDVIGFLTAQPDETTAQIRKGILSRQQRYTKPSKTAKTYTDIDDAIAARVRHSDLTFELAAIIVNRSLCLTESGYRWQYDSKLQLTSPYRFSEAQAQNVVKSISAPTLFIYAEDGVDFVKPAIKRYQPLFKNISCYHLVGGHHVHMEKPQQVAHLINEFLSNNFS
ncbi:MAG: alpha/beta fold hydrolase [Thalassotalea sp.]